MKSVLRYKGLSLAKDELAAENGELSLCANCEVKDGAIRPSVLEGTATKSPLTVQIEGQIKPSTLLFVHKTSNYSHFICYASTGKAYVLYAFSFDGAPIGKIDHDFNSIPSSVSSVGNTLVIICDGGLHYSLWKNTDSAYKYIGQKPPFLSIAFGLSKNYTADYETGGIDVDGSDAGFDVAFQQTSLGCSDAFQTPIQQQTSFKQGDIQLKVKTSNESTVTEAIWGLVNRTNNKISKSGHFYANFLVRYCYRLYDGSMIMHSAPVFVPVLVPDQYLVYAMNAHMQNNYQVTLWDKLEIKRKDATGKEYAFRIDKLTFMYYPRNVALTYAVDDTAETVDDLKDWSDIISSVDIFITPPIVGADQGQTIKSLCYRPDNFALNTSSAWAQDWTTYGKNASNTPIPYPCKTVAVFPSVSGKSYSEKVASQAAFFKLHSFALDDIKPTTDFPQNPSSWPEVPYDSSVVENIATQEAMKDDYKTHNLLMPTSLYIYNHRLHLFGLKERLFHGFGCSQMFAAGSFPYVSTQDDSDGNPQISPWPTVYKIVVRLSTTEGYKYVEAPLKNYFRLSWYQLYNFPVFYPDARADHMYIYFSTDLYPAQNNFFWTDFKLTACSELNGAMHVGDFQRKGQWIGNYPCASAPTYSSDDVVDMANKIYTSEQDNPFFFPINGINTVGTGSIVGIAATTRALSQGQFGQFPLMAFCTDGVWALTVSTSGTYSAIHPISRHVCNNPSSICQLDQSVVFATDRSLYALKESSVSSISERLDGPLFDIAKSLKELISYYTKNTYDPAILQLINLSEAPSAFFADGTCLYDNANNRLIIYPKLSQTQEQTISVLVYAIADKAWSTMAVPRPLALLNAYPYAYIQRSDGTVICLDRRYSFTDEAPHNALIITRTLTFDQTMLAISGFDQQTSSKNQQTIFFYGSNDNRTWHYIGASSRRIGSYLPAHTYRYFRVAVALRLSQDESYSQTYLDITQKYQKL